MSKRGHNISYDSQTPQLQIVSSEDRKHLITGITPNNSKHRLFSDSKYQFISQMNKSPLKDRATPSRFENQFVRYSENSFINPNKKDNEFAFPRENEQHNYTYIGQIVALEKRRKARILYRRKEIQRQAVDTQAKNVGQLQFNKAKERVSEPTQSCQPTVQKSMQGEMTLEEMHYEMVRTQQKCKRMNME